MTLGKTDLQFILDWICILQNRHASRGLETVEGFTLVRPVRFVPQASILQCEVFQPGELFNEIPATQESTRRK